MPHGFRLEQSGALGTIVFAREEGLNVLSRQLLTELGQAFSQLENSAVRVCVFRAEGKAFLAGADIREMSALSVEQAHEFSALGQEVLGRIEDSEIISLAALHGACLGGGCELALACDIRIAAAGLLLGQPEVTLGLVPGFGGSVRLPELAGPGWARRMLLSGEPLNEVQALGAGLITEYCELGALQVRAEQLAQTLLARAPAALRSCKQLLKDQSRHPRLANLKRECRSFSQTFALEAPEGLRAFNEKRRAKY